MLCVSFRRRLSLRTDEWKIPSHFLLRRNSYVLSIQCIYHLNIWNEQTYKHITFFFLLIKFSFLHTSIYGSFVPRYIGVNKTYIPVHLYLYWIIDTCICIVLTYMYCSLVVISHLALHCLNVMFVYCTVYCNMFNPCEKGNKEYGQN